MSVLKNPEDICNTALIRIGHTRRIGNIFEGSPESVAALQVYGQTRDQKLRSFDWGFAERDLQLNLLKIAPVGGYSNASPWTSANPIPPWIYEYSYPTDCLKLRSLRGNASLIPQFDPKPTVFRIANDTVTSVQQKVILCNKENAVAVYTGQITDPTLWEPSFMEAFIDDLGVALALALANVDALKVAGQEDAGDTMTAQGKLG